MTVEQLLCPAVITWEKNYRQHLNESNITMTDDEIADEFDKWLAENEDLINKSVEDNIEHINEVINRNMNKLHALNEGEDSMFNFDDEDFAGVTDEEDKPLTGDVETGDGEEKIDPTAPEERLSASGNLVLTNKKEEKNNIFGVINEFYDQCVEEGTTEMSHKGIFRHLDVSRIHDMSALFAFTDFPNINLSSWDTGNVKTMEGMFYKSTFNNDSICSWDVSSCTYFANMFLFCPFNQSLKRWTPGFVSRVFRNSDGTTEEKTVRADLPLIGGTEDETRAIAKTYRRGMFKKWKDEEDAEAEVPVEAEANESKMRHVIDYDAFVNEGKVGDFLRRGVERVKDFFRGIALKLDKIVAFFKEDGEIYEATSPYTALNLAAAGEIPGVTAFCDVRNEYLEGVPVEADIVPSPEYYGIIDKESVEYRNYETFKGMITEHYEKYGNTGGVQVLNEEDFKRVGFSAAEGGVDALDIKSDDLLEILDDLIKNVPAYKGDEGGKAVFIWGAPGIGKSTIPKAIVRKWNEKKENEFHKKALMVVQCGDLTIDGFSLPIPMETSVGEYLDERPQLRSQIESQGISAEALERIKKNMHKVSAEAPKTWLPAFKTNATQEEIDILNDIANGYLDIRNKGGKIIKTETTEGGILLFDEFFRANESVFKIMMQLILNREYSGYMLGNKWGILCCSNRPEDDEEVRTGFEKTGAVVGTRMLAGAYNFIPSFDEWKKWAVSQGGFDPITLEFLMLDQDPNNGEFTNWHTIRPDEYIQKGKTAWPTPRTWSALISELHFYMDNHGFSKLSEIPEEKFKRIASGIIGQEMGYRYVDYVMRHADDIAVDAQKMLEDPEYKIPAESKCADVTRQIEQYVLITYDDENVPDISLLMNMFNNLDATYSGTKDNFVKMMHVNILKHFKIMTNKANRIALKDYIMAVEKRYKMTPTDLK